MEVVHRKVQESAFSDAIIIHHPGSCSSGAIIHHPLRVDLIDLVDLDDIWRILLVQRPQVMPVSLSMKKFDAAHVA